MKIQIELNDTDLNHIKKVASAVKITPEELIIEMINGLIDENNENEFIKQWYAAYSESIKKNDYKEHILVDEIKKIMKTHERNLKKAGVSSCMLNKITADEIIENIPLRNCSDIYELRYNESYSSKTQFALFSSSVKDTYNKLLHHEFKDLYNKNRLNNEEIRGYLDFLYK